MFLRFFLSGMMGLYLTACEQSVTMTEYDSSAVVETWDVGLQAQGGGVQSLVLNEQGAPEAIAAQLANTQAESEEMMDLAYEAGWDDSSVRFSSKEIPITGAKFGSPHDYPDKANLTWVIKVPSATRVRVHFNRFATEQFYDVVNIRDQSNQLVGAPLHGDQGALWTPWVDGDTLKVQLVSDSSGHAYGFEVDAIDSELGGQDEPLCLLNINTAGADSLTSLSGIGPSIASRIVQFRDLNGEFASVDDLIQVSGIGAATLNKFRDVISVTERMDINTVNAAVLDTLPGIGVKKASAIVAFRDSNRFFSSIKDLMKVNGVGQKLFDKVRGQICASPQENFDVPVAEEDGANIYGDDTLSVAAFNVQVFGQRKLSKPEVVDVLVHIFRRYDLVLLQEIRDRTETSASNFLDLLNDYAGPKYALVEGSRVGRTSSKEQYAYFYRADKLQVIDRYEYDDGQEPDADTFQREPLNVLFEAGDYRFFVAGIHTAPRSAVAEVDTLADVYDDVVARFEITNGLIMGDFNADCNYVRPSRFQDIRLYGDPDNVENPFEWLIGHDVDTTVSATNCAYDRFVATGDIGQRLSEGGATVFLFDQVYGLDNRAARKVSDHYPIQLGITLP
jgi:competence ComEA-like helix-hairpin-helix protein